MYQRHFSEWKAGTNDNFACVLLDTWIAAIGTPAIGLFLFWLGCRLYPRNRAEYRPHSPPPPNMEEFLAGLNGAIALPDVESGLRHRNIQEIPLLHFDDPEVDFEILPHDSPNNSIPPSPPSTVPSPPTPTPPPPPPAASPNACMEFMNSYLCFCKNRKSHKVKIV